HARRLPRRDAPGGLPDDLRWRSRVAARRGGRRLEPVSPLPRRGAARGRPQWRGDLRARTRAAPARDRAGRARLRRPGWRWPLAAPLGDDAVRQGARRRAARADLRDAVVDDMQKLEAARRQEEAVAAHEEGVVRAAARAGQAPVAVEEAADSGRRPVAL